MTSDEPGVLEDVKFPILILYKENMGAMVNEDKRRVYVLDNFEFLVSDPDLGDITREEVYCHWGVDAKELWPGIGECEYNASKVKTLMPGNVGLSS